VCGDEFRTDCKYCKYFSIACFIERDKLSFGLRFIIGTVQAQTRNRRQIPSVQVLNTLVITSRLCPW
jgi:hypothetical protein